MKRLLPLLPVLVTFLVGAMPAHAWTWPVEGPVLRPFVFGDDPYAAGQHRGIDIGAPTGTNVSAPASGTVSFAGTVPHGGRTVTIQTADGFSVTLVHLGSYSVGRGASVAEGAVVGTVGPSGDAELSVPYVYLGVRVTADPQGYVDPLAYLPASGSPGSGDSGSDSGSAGGGAGSGGGAKAAGSGSAAKSAGAATPAPVTRRTSARRPATRPAHGGDVVRGHAPSTRGRTQAGLPLRVPAPRDGAANETAHGGRLRRATDRRPEPAVAAGGDRPALATAPAPSWPRTAWPAAVLLVFGSLLGYAARLRRAELVAAAPAGAAASRARRRSRRASSSSCSRSTAERARTEARCTSRPGFRTSPTPASTRCESRYGRASRRRRTRLDGPSRSGHSRGTFAARC